jgi:hypothetical protein
MLSLATVAPADGGKMRRGPSGELGA